MPLLLQMLLVLPLASAEWYQTGYDAARTGEIPFAGPTLDDVAFHVKLPGSGVSLVIVDRAVYALLRGNLDEDLPVHGIFRVGLDDANVTEVARFEGTRGRLATDGKLLFTYNVSQVEAYPFSGGQPVWTYPFPELATQRNAMGCGYPAIERGTLFLACEDRMFTEAEAGTLGQAGQPVPGDESVGFVAALNATTGAQEWLWVRDAVQQAAGSSLPPGVAPTVNRNPRFNFYAAVAVRDPFVYLYSLDRYGDVEAGATPVGDATTVTETVQYSLTALDSETGRMLWSRNDTEHRAAPLLEPVDWTFGTQPVANDNAVFIQLDRLEALNPARGGSPVWSREVGKADAVTGRGSPGFGLAGNVLLATSQQTLYRFDADDGDVQWQYTLPLTTNETWGVYPIAVSGGTAYAMASPLLANTDIVYAIDIEDGATLWRHEFFSPVGDPRFVVTVPAMDEGVFVVAMTDGSVVAVGETGASIQVRADPSTRYPEVGGRFSVDLSGTRAGAQGPPTAFRLQFPNGTWTAWQAEPRIETALDAGGSQTVRLQARNDAGQTASQLVPLEIGATPPHKPSLLERAFSAPVAVGLALFATVAIGALLLSPRIRTWLVTGRSAPDPRGHELYRAALEQAVADGEGHSTTNQHILETLRSRLQISAREHALMEASVRSRFGTGTEGPLAGKTFLGRYQVERLLGEGGFGRTFLARDQQMGRLVALKVARISSPEEAKRALKEARLAARLRHPNVVAIHDVEEVAGDLILILEYVEGGSLAERLRQAPLGFEGSVRVLDDVLAGLEAAHAEGIVHRDIKPENVLLTADGQAKLADFGIARGGPGTGTVTGLSAAGAQAGTLHYMSPEQVRGQPVDARSDLYSLGVVWYEALAGRSYLNFRGRAEFDVRLAILDERPRLPIDGVPKAMNALLARLLAKDPEGRPATVADVRRELKTVVASVEAGSRNGGPAVRARQKRETA